MTAAPQGSRRRPAYLRPALLLTVAAGGSVGTLTRALLAAAFPPAPGGWPWVTFGVNVTGAFLLGLVLQALALRGPDEGARRLTRLALGTGVLGGYTTYSTFAVETAALGRDGEVVLATAYDAASLLAGLVAAWLGVLLAEALPQRASGPDAGRR
ncbi:MAG: CrcB family protein [Austwickia sp.]|nr:MAG: CrcB family protein [Austwickia sp.]